MLQVLLFEFTRVALHLDLLVLVVKFDAVLKVDKLLLPAQLNIFGNCVDFDERSERIVTSGEFYPVHVDPEGFVLTCPG